MNRNFFFILIFTFFFSEISFAKVEKTNIGFSIDIPSDLIVVNRKNYEEVKKTINYIPERRKRLLSETEIKSIENDNGQTEKYLSVYETGGYLIFGLIPTPPKNYLSHNISFSKFDKTDFNQVISDKNFLNNICQEFLKQAQNKGSAMKNLKLDKCKIDKNKFKNLPQTIKVTYDLSKIPNISKIYVSGLQYEGYFFNFNNYSVYVELLSEKQNYHILDNQLINVVNSIK